MVAGYCLPLEQTTLFIACCNSSTMKLSEYIARRNGVPAGHSSSLKNMLLRSFGAASFAGFWRYWNPIWSYYLGRYIYKPLKKQVPRAAALVLTFAFCGFLHDVVIMLIRKDFALLFTPWFVLMAACIVLSEALRIRYTNYPFPIRALINTISIGLCFALAYTIQW